MHRRRRSAVLLLVLPGLLAASFAQAADLLQVYDQARRADPLLAGAAATRQAVAEDVHRARAPLLPQATLSAGVAHDSLAGRAADNRGSTIGVTLSQVLVDVARSASVDASRATADAQQALYRAAEQNLLVRVARAYFDVLGAEHAVTVAEANQTAFGQQVEQASERLRQGLSAAVDVEQARAYHASARAALIHHQKVLADAREALAEITGQAPGGLATLPPGVNVGLAGDSLPPAETWSTLAVAHNPELQARQALVEAAERRIGAARAGHYPTLGATLDSGRQRQWPLAGAADGRQLTSVGLQLNIPLAAGGAVQAQTRQARHQRDAAASELEWQRRRVLRDVMQHHHGVTAGQAQTEATQAAVDAANKALASTRVGQGLGTQTMNELLQAIQQLGAAQNAHTTARHQVVLSRLLLLQAAGTLSEADLAAINTLLQEN